MKTLQEIVDLPVGTILYFEYNNNNINVCVKLSEDEILLIDESWKNAFEVGYVININMWDSWDWWEELGSEGLGGLKIAPPEIAKLYQVK
jgi:hypothetical protein